jgi:hypothetical protein
MGQFRTGVNRLVKFAFFSFLAFFNSVVTVRNQSCGVNRFYLSESFQTG